VGFCGDLLRGLFGGTPKLALTPNLAPVSPVTNSYLSGTQVARVRGHLPVYQRACSLVQIEPPLVMAGLHYREAEFATTSQVPGGCFQLDPEGKGAGADLRAQIDDYVAKVCKLYGVPSGGPGAIETDFFVACLTAAHELKTKVRVKPIPVVLEGDILADTLWGYNGKSRHHVPVGTESDPKNDQNGKAIIINRSWKYSPYVSNDPKHGVSLRMTGTMPDPKDSTKRISIDRVDGRPGALAIIRELTLRQAELA
jgi:hypothetical protein